VYVASTAEPAIIIVPLFQRVNTLWAKLPGKVVLCRALRVRDAAQTASTFIRDVPSAGLEPVPRREESSTVACVLNTRAPGCRLFQVMDALTTGTCLTTLKCSKHWDLNNGWPNKNGDGSARVGWGSVGTKSTAIIAEPD
jgi:hypothetical protein